MTRSEWAKMTKSEKNILVAELAGWERGPVKCLIMGRIAPTVIRVSYWHKKGEQDNWQGTPPSFCSDLNAMHEAEKTITEYGTRAMYINEVYGIICREMHGGKFIEESAVDVLPFATADQKALAFVMTMEGKQ